MAEPPSPPYTQFVVDGGTGSWLLTGVLAFDATNSVITTSDYGGDGFQINARTANFEHSWHVVFRPPTGSTLTVGTTYPTLRNGPDATHGFMDIGGDGRGCNYQSGLMTVKELTLAPGSTRPTVLAATFSTSCESDTQVFFGEARFNSSMSVAVTTAAPRQIDFGQQPVGLPGEERTVTVTAAGSADSVLGAASIVEGDTFAITTDTCSNTTLTPGGTCTIGVRAQATAREFQTALLRLAVNGLSGALYTELGLTGIDPKRLAVSPVGVHFGTVIVGQDSAIEAVSLKANGFSPVTIGAVTLGGNNPEAFRIIGGSCQGTTLQVGQSCTITVMSHPTVRGYQSARLLIANDSMTGTVSALLEVEGQSVNAGTYYPLAPSRILDTRVGKGAPLGPVGPGGSIHLQVTGEGGVPTLGVSAVVLNVTVTGPTTSGHITVWPTGASMPTASSLNFSTGWTGANSVTTALGNGGRVDLFNSAGNTHLIVDVVGYYAQDNALVSSRGYGGEFQPTLPQRLFDSRIDFGEKIPGGEWVELGVSFDETIDPHVRALAVNVTAVDGSGDGYLTTFSGGQATPPLASTLNFTRTGAVPNFAVVPTGYCVGCAPWQIPVIGIYVSVDVHVIVDVVGFYDDGSFAHGPDAGLRFTPRTPLRITDSRIGLGMTGPLGAASTVSLAPPPASLPAATEAVALNVTAVSPTSTTFISVWPTGLPQPLVSTLNPNAGQIVPNAAPVLLGAGNMFNVYNNAGSVHLVIDMVGTFYLLPAVTSIMSKATSGGDGGPVATRLKAQLHQ
jgi:hypothetical protein